MSKIYSFDETKLIQSYEIFKAYVEHGSNGHPFKNFQFNIFLSENEKYKMDLYKKGQILLDYINWEKTDIGCGKIIQNVISAIEQPENNLLEWNSKRGEEQRNHQKLYLALSDKKEIFDIEAVLFNLYHTSNDEETFNQMISIFGKKYAFIAYLFFLKDITKYLPIRTTKFDKFFHNHGSSLTTAYKCSWENYIIYLDHISEVQDFLNSIGLNQPATLIDAHSFVWVVTETIPEDNNFDIKDISSYSKPTEKQTIITQRIGHDKFKKKLINYWKSSSVNKCTSNTFLIASHIKPWKKANDKEKLDVYNGLLLTPNLDKAFDKGFISFDDYGKIIISKQLSSENMAILGIHPEMKLTKIEENHLEYLKYHREKILLL